MQTYNINKEIQQIQNNIGIIISYFFIKQNQTLVPKIDPDYVNNQISNLSDKISKINPNYHNGFSDTSSSFSPKHIEFLNKSISQIHLHDLSETTTSKYFDEKRLKEIEEMIQKQKVQIRELGGLLQKYANTPIQPIQTNSQPIIKNFIIPDNEVSKLNAQIKAIDSKMSLFKNDINQYVLDKRNAVNKSLKLFSGEYKRLLKMIKSLNITLSNQINSLSTRVTTLNNQTNTKIDNVNLLLSRKIELTNTTLNTIIDTVNTSLTATISQKEATLNTRIDTVNNSLTVTIGEKEAALNTRIDTVNNNLTVTIGEKEAVLNTRINAVNTGLTATISQKEAALNTRIDTVNASLTATIGEKESALNSRINAVNTSLTATIGEKESALNTRINAVNTSLTATIGEKEAVLNTRINAVNTSLTATISQKEAALNTRIDTVNTSLTATIDEKEAALNTRIDTVNTSLTATIGEKEAELNTRIDTVNNHIDTNFGVLYENSNQTSNRIVYFNKIKVNEIEFAAVSNISDITSLSVALGNLTTDFNSIYQNTNVSSDKTAYFNKVISENIECNNFTGVSDERLKKNIVDLKNVGGDLHKLRTVGFDWKSTNEADIGFIAQDVEKIFPSLVKTNKDGFKSVKYINFVPILVQGYREQADEIRKLKKILIIGLVVFFFLFMYKCI